MIPKLVIVTEIIAPYRIPIFNALAQPKEIDLHVVFLSENDSTLRQWRVYKDEIKFTYQVLPSWRQRFGRHNILINRGLRSALNRLKPDVILCGGYNYLASWTAAYWAQRHRVRFFLWSESTAFDLRRRHCVVEFMKMRFLRLCTGFVVPGGSSLNYLKEMGIHESRIVTAPNAVEIALFSRLAAAARRDESRVRSRWRLPERYFLYAGRLVKAKGIFDLLDAYAQLQPQLRSEFGLVFVGDGSDAHELEKRASKISPGNIKFLGFLHREELPEAYALADALIFPTHSDPWGLVVNEAMACGLPVIATDVAGCTLDLVQDGWNGFVIPARNVSRLALAMEALAGDPQKRLEMGRRSWERVNQYSPAAWAEKIQTFVQPISAVAR